MIVCEVQDGALVKAPVWEDHKRGKNWAAVISKDPRAPGGLARVFVERARGSYLYMVDGLVVGQPVEFGADYYSTRGNLSRRRWYGVVRAVGNDAIEFEEFPTPAKAIAASKMPGVQVPSVQVSSVTSELVRKLKIIGSDVEGEAV